MSAIDQEQLEAIRQDALWLCNRLKEVREIRGMRLTEVGARIGTTHSRISDTESCRYDPKLSTILRIMSALGISWEQLVRGAPRISELPPVSGRVIKKGDASASPKKRPPKKG